ncbi:polysaccharide pyruvyl transferase family protein [Sutcliffiella sp. NPDC057660]|uniref:polysaccharide pyruvyl transferase family protein n=1 Tax=Sutcliffiella sp. NPDC057660 TaxID=3346199 RepID=UPI0036A357A0
MKKILVNAYFAENLGDDLFLKVLFDRYPQTRFYLLTSNNSYSNIFSSNINVKVIKSINYSLFGVRTINIFEKINDYFLKYSFFDGMVVIGGSIFMENKNWEIGLQKRIKLPKMLKKKNKKTYIIGANFGPYDDEAFVDKHKEFFSYFDDICFRDSYSYNLFEKLHNVRCAPDVVFNLNYNYDNNQCEEKSIGFSIIDLKNRPDLEKYSETYVDKIVELVKNFLAKGLKIKFFSFCKKEGDLNAIEKIMSKLSARNQLDIKVHNYIGNVNEFLNEFRECEIIVGTRFHSIILALANSQKIIPILYSDKTFNMLKDLGLEKNSFYIEHINELTADIIDSLNRDYFVNRKQIIEDANKQFEKLDLLIG